MVKPRIEHAPRARSSRGAEACELAEHAGLLLDDWQQYVLNVGLRERGPKRRRKWAAFEVGVCVSRQNGKGGILEARELASLFLFPDRLTVHSAHQFDTSLEAFRRLEDLIDGTPDLRAKVKRVSRSHGEEGIELRDGSRIRFRTRTKGGGRGFTGDCVILDEAMVISAMMHGALLPTMSAKSVTGNPQIWYTGSAVDQLVMEHGVVFARVRQRAEKGEDPTLAYMEWSADGEIDKLDGVIDERCEWERANPALGIRISEEFVKMERRSMDARTFAVERLGIGDWPPVDSDEPAMIDIETWLALADVDSRIDGGVCLAFDVTPDRSRAVISAAGERSDELLHLETIEHGRGTHWVAKRIGELVERHPVDAIAYDPASPAAALVPQIEELGIELVKVGARDYASACGNLYDLVEQDGLRHLGTAELTAAIRYASTRPLGEAWAWSRRLSVADISPLVAGTLALWLAAEARSSVYDSRGLIAI